MKFKFMTLVLMLLVLAVACAGPAAPAGNSTEQKIGFMVSQHQFVKNTYKGETNPSYLLIRSYPAFESQFGVAAVMNMDRTKLITEEKMKNGFVLSIIYQGNNIHEFKIEKVILKGSQLQVYYTSKVTEPNATWTCNCNVTALIDNCKFDSILLYENGQPLPNAKVKEL